MPRLAGALRAPIWRALAVSVVTLGLLVVAWRHFGAATGLAPVSLSVGPILLALLGCALFLVGRGWRLRHLLDDRVAFTPLLATVGISWGAGLLLPGPSADATFVVLGRRRLGVGARRGTSVSILARLLDVISLALVVAIAAALSRAGVPVEPVVVAALVGAGSVVVLAVCLHQSGRAVLRGLLVRLRRTRPWAEPVEEALAELSRPRTLGMLAVTTVMCRLATLLQYAALFAMLGVHLDLWGIWFVLAVRTILSTIPIQGLAGLGTSQIWWTSALVLEGVAAGSAVGISITLSLLDLAVSCPIILLCWLLSKVPARLPGAAGDEPAATRVTVAGTAAASPQRVPDQV